MTDKKTESTGLYTAGMVCGIIGVVLAFIPLFTWAAYVLSILALIFGIIGLVRKVKTGKALAATILGAVALVVSIIWTIIAVNTVNKVMDITTDYLNSTNNYIKSNY